MRHTAVSLLVVFVPVVFIATVVATAAPGVAAAENAATQSLQQMFDKEWEYEMQHNPVRASNLGAPVTICGRDSAPSRAYFDAARRLAGETVDMVIPADKEGLFTKLFGRRAA